MLDERVTVRVLIIDDYEDFRLILASELEDRGAYVTQCASGNNAIQLLKSGEEFDLVISDYEMPDGNGLSVLEYLYKVDHEVKFALYTSYPNLTIPIVYKNFLGTFLKEDLNKVVELVVSLRG